ncbi:MAG: hypothetical protein JXR51_15375 [Bacteroidales bacterium]|nr:hypothetical protein [Bacteroidales bacterium]MBN2758551.1 hypothetical protein [Bacteroidales bacterium]
MKKLCLLLTSIFIFSFQQTIAQVEPRTPEGTNQSQTYKFNDNENGTSMMPIMGDALPAIKYIEDTLKVEIVRIEYDLIFTTKSSFRTLYTGWKYGIYAIGDYRIKKISIAVYKSVNKEWQYVTTVNPGAYSALSLIEPEETEDYLFQVKVEEFEEGFSAGHYSLIIYH